jgi:anti-anti-sigma regulatory factor
MRDLPPLVVTVDWAAGVATVVVNGELDPLACSRLQERLAWVAESRPRRLVLDLRGAAARSGEQVTALIAAARQQLPPGCHFDVRPAIPAMRGIIEIAGQAERWPAQAGEEARPARAGDSETSPTKVRRPKATPGNRHRMPA